MELEVYDCAKDLSAAEEESRGYNLLALSDGFDEQLQELIRKGSLDFDTWTSIISKIEKTYPDDIEKICLVYDSFLSEFPLCHGYWRKLAAHKAHLCKVDKAVEIFERAVQSATYCVGLWVDYCSFSMSAYEDPSDVRRLFKRAMSFVGKDYLCYPLWDKYIEFEFTQQQWSELAQIYVQTLMFPTKRLHRYYDNFKKFAAIMEEEMGQHKNCSSELESDSAPDASFTAVKDEVSCVINSLLDPSTGSFSHKELQKYKWLGERFYQEACDLERRIHCFETNIRRPYFHMMPLDDKQLENWHHYLDFVEMQDDFDWAVKVYERCLIPCADYPEFWMRYVEFMEMKGGRELANFALDRATKVFLKNMPAIHLFNARFKEQIGDRYGARAAFLWSDTELSSDFIEKVIKEANMEKRLENFAAASSVYEKALVMAAQQQKLHSVPVLYLHFSRLKYMMTGSIDAARDIIIDGIQHVPHCKLLLEGLIYFLMMHGGLGQVDVVDAIIADAIAPGSDASHGLGAKDREDLSVLYLQFVDQCGTVDDIIKAWNRHIKLFPHLLRTTSSNRLPTSGNQLLDVLMGRSKNPFPKRYRPFGDHNPDQPTQLQMQDERLSLPEKHDIHPDRVFTNQLQTEEKDDSSQERLQQLSPRIAEQGTEDESMVDKPTHDSEHQSGDDESGRTESTAYALQSAEAVCEPVESTRGLAHETGEDADGPIEPSHEDDAPKPMEATDGLVDQPGEDASGPIQPTHDIVHQVADDDSFSDASQKYTDSINVQQEQDHEPEQHVKPLSVDSLPLNSQEKEYGDSTPMSSYEHRSPTSDRPSKFKRAKGSPSIVSPGSSQSHDSARIQNESVKPSSVASHQNPLPEQPQPQVPTDGAGNWHHSKDTVQPSGDARSGCLGDSPSQQNQQRRVSPQQQCLPADASAQKLTSQGDSHHSLPGQNPQVQQGIQEQNWTQVGAAQGSSTTHSWPTENLQQQSFESAHHQLPASPVQAQMPEFSVQSGGQYGNAGNNQAYNQMMENYFRQQQQMVVQQHYEQQQQYVQLLQQQAQQPHQPQQHLQPYQQLPQMQHHLAQIYYQQLPQMHGQQAQLMQQQLMHAYQQQGQFYHQYMQLQGQHQQQQPMQQQQAYQQLQQQHQMQQQGYQVVYQQPQQLQQEEGQMQHQQQITSAQTPAGNGSYYQQQSSSQNLGGSHYRVESGQQFASQDQQVMSPHSARSSQSPHPQQQSQGTTPPRRAVASGSSLSPHNRQQRSRGVTPHSAGTSRRAASPYNQQRSP